VRVSVIETNEITEYANILGTMTIFSKCLNKHLSELCLSINYKHIYNGTALIRRSYVCVYIIKSNEVLTPFDYFVTNYI